MVVRVAMDLFQHPYYRLNKTIMTIIGQWPYQSTLTKCGCRATVIFICSSQIISRIRTIVNNHGDWNIVVDFATPLFTELACVTCLFGFMWNAPKTLKLLNRMHRDWQVWAREREVNILHEYTELGKNINIAFTATVYTVLFIGMTQPAIAKIIDVLLKNGTEPGKFVIPVDYYNIDEQKYYFYIIMYSYVMAVMVTLLAVASNIMLVSYVQHDSGIFAALGLRLERIGNNDTSEKTEETSIVPDHRYMVELAWCVDRHNDAIEYANLIDAAYTWNVFVTTSIGVMLLNLLGLQVLVNSNNPGAMTRYVAFALFSMLYFLMECYVSQILIDHSTDIRIYIYNSQWYRLSIKAQKLLQFMTMRCNVPCQLTAGNIMIISLKTTVLMLRTTASYFAFVRSTQGL